MPLPYYGIRYFIRLAQHTDTWTCHLHNKSRHTTYTDITPPHTFRPGSKPLLTPHQHHPHHRDPSTDTGPTKKSLGTIFAMNTSFTVLYLTLSHSLQLQFLGFSWGLGLIRFPQIISNVFLARRPMVSVFRRQVYGGPQCNWYEGEITVGTVSEHRIVI